MAFPQGHPPIIPTPVSIGFIPPRYRRTRVKRPLATRCRRLFRLGIGLGLGLIVLAGCTTEQPPPVPQSPAAQLPRGVATPGDAPTNAAQARAPMLQWLAAFARVANDAGVPHYLIGPAQQPIIAAIALHYDDFEPQILRHPGDAAGAAARTPGDKPGVSARDALENQSVAVVGSGFLSLVRALEPLGLLKVDGVQISELEIHGYTRVLGINAEQRFGVQHRSEYAADTFSSALQAGPGIIEQGLLDISTKDLERPRYFRSFVATCTDRVLIGVTLEPMNLRTLGEQLLQAAYEQHLGCDEVINLAGDREAVFALRSDTQWLYHGDPSDQKAALIGFRRKAQ